MATKAKGKKVSEIEDLKELPSEKATAKESETKTTDTKKVKILKLICRPEGTFLPGCVYELDSRLADKFIESKRAETV